MQPAVKDVIDIFIYIINVFFFDTDELYGKNIYLSQDHTLYAALCVVCWTMQWTVLCVEQCRNSTVTMLLVFSFFCFFYSAHSRIGAFQWPITSST